MYDYVKKKLKRKAPQRRCFQTLKINNLGSSPDRSDLLLWVFWSSHNHAVNKLLLVQTPLNILSGHFDPIHEAKFLLVIKSEIQINSSDK